MTEKAWFKPKKDEIKINLDLQGISSLEEYISNLEQSKYVLDELEEWVTKENEYDDYKDIVYRETMGYVLDKIQELKKDRTI